MRRYIARQFRLPSNGEDVTLVFDNQTGLPLDTPSAWLVTTQMGHRREATMQSRARVMAQMYNWADHLGLDIDERLKAGQSLSLADVNSLCGWLSRDHSPRKLVDIRVQGASHKGKVAVVCNYLQWLADRATLARKPDDPAIQHIQTLCDTTIRRLKDLVIRPQDKPKLGLAVEEQKLLLDLIVPGSPNNPFKGYTQERNYLYLLLLFSTGARMSELLHLTLQNVHTREDKPFIYIDPADDKDIVDPRADRPQVKTLGRPIGITANMARLVQGYITGTRQQRPNARKTAPYLFLSSRFSAAPWSKGGVEGMIVVIRRNFAQLQQLTPHILRHTFNENFDRQFKNSGLEEERLLQARNYLCGWSPTSKQHKNYSLRAIQEFSTTLGLQLQNNLLRDFGISD